MVLALTLLLCGGFVEALTLRQHENPMRKIITLLQDMQKEIEADGEKEEEAFEKFMCYCDGNTDQMYKASAAGKQMVETLKSKLESMKAEKAQLEQELKGHKDSRAAATQDMAKAEKIRAKENEDFVAASTDMSTNIKAMDGAIAALEKGLSFVQMSGVQKDRVMTVVSESRNTDDYEKQEITDFLQGKTATQGSGEILGMLKSMMEEMEGDLKSATSDEATAKTGYEDLIAAKTAEVDASTSAIETKTKRSGELAVEIAQCSDDIEDTTAEVAETDKFLGDLGTQCAEKKAEWSTRQRTRAEEVAAISEAIKILNDDDALDLFKKTAFTQEGIRLMQSTTELSTKRRAERVLSALAQKSANHEAQLSFLAAALKSKKMDMSKISEMIDGMMTVLSSEQADDDKQKAFCTAELEKSAAEKKATDDKLESLEAAIEDMSATVSTLAEEIESLTSEIGALDKAVAEATAQRKDEHTAFVAAQAENQAATELVEKAKNRLFKVYRPELYKEAPKQELTEEEKLLVASGRSDLVATPAPVMFVQKRMVAVPPPPPETFGAYQKKDGKSNGVIKLMEMFIGDLKTDYTDSKHAEEMAQKDYENLMSSSQKNRAEMAKSITGKESAKADWSDKIEIANTDHASTTEALAKIKQMIAELHSSCDFLIENYDARKEARTNEVEGLKNSKAVLSGASFE
jgi:chromosome segregation ATPase